MLLARTSAAPRFVRPFFVLLFVVFTCVFPYNEKIHNPNENVRTYMTMAIVEHGTFEIDDIVRVHGWVNDMARVPADEPRISPYGGGHLYCIKGPANGYLGVPFYWAFTKIAPLFGHDVPTEATPPAERDWWLRASTLVVRLFTVQLPCFLFLVWFERWLRRTTKDDVIRLSAVAACGVGTNYLAYSMMFASHSLFAVAAFVSFGLIMRERELFPYDARQRRLSRAFLAGLFAGLASLLEYTAFPVSCGLALYAFTTFYRPTRLFAFGAGALVCAALLCFYQWRSFGDPLLPGHKMPDNPGFAFLQHGFFGLGKPDLDRFGTLTFSHRIGFFGTSPFMWLGLLAIPLGLFSTYGTPSERRNRRLATGAWLFIMLGLWLAISCTSNYDGGWAVGPRYLGAAPPFFAFGAACAMERIARFHRFARAIARGVAGGLAVASVLQMGYVGLFYNTYADSVTRPLPQFALPMSRAGFVPHHAGELFGWMSPTFWYAIAAGMFLAVLLPALWPLRDRISTYAVRVVTLAVAFVVGIQPAFSDPDPKEGGDLGKWNIGDFVRQWEPHDRDRIFKLREQAERYGTQRPCLWFAITDLEHSLGLEGEAARDEQRAGAPRSACP